MTPDDLPDVIELLTPNEQTTAKRLRGKYDRLEEAGAVIRCDACTTAPGTPETVVAAFPRPRAEGEALLCQACWAAEAAARTSLEEAEAEVLALRWAGLEIPEMASATGLAEREAEERLRELHRRTSEIGAKHAEIERTRVVLKAVDHRRP